MTHSICSQCLESAVRRAPRGAGSGWSLNVEPARLEWSHADGEPLCPEMTSTGYQPALPTSR